MAALMPAATARWTPCEEGGPPLRLASPTLTNSDDGGSLRVTARCVARLYRSLDLRPGRCAGAAANILQPLQKCYRHFPLSARYFRLCSKIIAWDFCGGSYAS